MRFFTSSFLALQFTFGTLAVGRFNTFVEASEFFTNGLTFRFRSLASGVATSRFANRFTLGATFLFTLILGATDSADRLFTMNSAFSASSFLTLHLAFRSFTNRVADSRALRIITLPFAGRMAFFS